MKLRTRTMLVVSLSAALGVAVAARASGPTRLPAHPPQQNYPARPPQNNIPPRRPVPPPNRPPTSPPRGTGTPPEAGPRPPTETRPGRPSPGEGEKAGLRQATDRRPDVRREPSTLDRDRWRERNDQFRDGRPWWGGREGWNKPWYGRMPAWYWGRPWYNFHHGWHHGYWDYWQTPPAVWFGGDGAAGSSVVYNNTFSPTTNITQQFDYSKPLPAPTPEQTVVAFPPDPPARKDGRPELTPAAAPPLPDTKDAAVVEANWQFGAAREAFKKGDYAKAESRADAAIEERPSDATLHEFRALALFAQGKYREAATGLYAVLAAGPGWDKQTMLKLYPDADTYIGQLRGLKAFTAAEPDAGHGHFLLAYHYLTLGTKTAAVKHLREVVRVQPDNELSVALLKVLR